MAGYPVCSPLDDISMLRKSHSDRGPATSPKINIDQARRKSFDERSNKSEAFHVIDIVSDGTQKEKEKKKKKKKKKDIVSDERPVGEAVDAHRHRDDDGPTTESPVVQLVNFCYFLLKMAAVVLGFSCLSMFSLAISVILLFSLSLVRILQLFGRRHDYARLVRAKHIIRLGLSICALLILIGLGIFFPFLKIVPHLEQKTLLELPLTKWTLIICIMSVLCIFSSLLYCIVHILPYIVCVLIDRHGFMIDRFVLIDRCVLIDRHATQATSEIIDGIFFLWASYATMKHAPSVRHHKILGLVTRKWINASILVLIGYNLITLLSRLIVFLLQKICQRHGDDDKSIWQFCLRSYFDVRYVVYYAKGMMVSVNSMMTSLLLLLTWTLYFGSHLDMRSVTAKYNWEVGKWTFVSLFVCSFLWLIKTFVLLTWEAHTIYHRLQHRILSTRVKSYFLSILGSTSTNFGDGIEEVFKKVFPKDKFKGADNDELLKLVLRVCPRLLYFFSILVLQFNKEIEDVRRQLEDILLIQKHTGLNIDAIQQVSQHFLQAKQDLSKETYLSDIQQKFPPRILDGSPQPEIRDGSSQPEEDFIRKELDVTEDDVSLSDKDRKYYLKMLFESLHSHAQQGQESTDSHQEGQESTKFRFPYSKVRTWVERAHNQCMNLANTISSAKELADSLNKIISWLLVGAIFIMWLLLTGLATTKVLVLIASPLLAATFIFGDTCKTLFQGIIYVFVVHPFDVGDLCVIEERLMEVRSIGIWTTTFVKVDKFGTTQELVIYSNSELTYKTVTNHKTKFDWSDRAEFNLGPSKMIKVGIKDEAMSFFYKSFITSLR